METKDKHEDMIKGLGLCPHCGTKQNDRQPQSHAQTQVIEYECGNTITYTFGEIGIEDSHISHEECENKIDWTNILVPHTREFDDKAKLGDDRFFGWIEYQFYGNYHNSNEAIWYSVHPNRSCYNKTYLDKYFENKELYFKSIRDLKDNPSFVEPQEKIIIKEYTEPTWVGEVSLKEVANVVNGADSTVIYKIVAAEEYQYIGSYIVEETTFIDDGKDLYEEFLYDKKVIDLIVKGL